MAKKKQEVINRWTDWLRDLPIGEPHECTTEEKLVIAPTATRLKKNEGLLFSITKTINGKGKECYEVLKLNPEENIITANQS